MRRLLALLLVVALAAPALADPVPSLWDPGQHPDKPDLSAVKSIRFLTADDYPPLDFALADGSLAGFNVEVARAVCLELGVTCTIQARRWDTLVAALESGQGDAMIASMRASPALRDKLAFTAPYYLTPARFAARKDFPDGEIDPGALSGKVVGVVRGSAHAAFLTTFFVKTRLKLYDDFVALHKGLQQKEVDAVFADGVTLAVWLSGEDAADCCGFRGGPFLESRYFGEGVGVALRREDVALRRALDWGLAQVWAKGRYTEIFRKYFPLSFY
jgi:polar amino acid transport system substrate-binding protein